MVQTVKQRVMEASLETNLDYAFYCFSKCETEKRDIMTMRGYNYNRLEIDPDEKTISIIQKSLDNRKIYNTRGKTGVIPCLNGFTAEVYCDIGTIIALVYDGFPYQDIQKINNLYNKNDPTKKIYGIRPALYRSMDGSGVDKYNVQTVW